MPGPARGGYRGSRAGFPSPGVEVVPRARFLGELPLVLARPTATVSNAEGPRRAALLVTAALHLPLAAMVLSPLTMVSGAGTAVPLGLVTVVSAVLAAIV